MLVQELLPVLTKMSELTVTSLCGTLRSKDTVDYLCDKYNIGRSFTDYDDMLNTLSPSLTEAVYIATPNNTHYDMAKKALEKGFNVILEKPFVLHSAQAEDLRAVARKNNLILLEAISNQYLPVYSNIKQNLHLIGEIKYVDCNFCQYSSRYDRFRAGEYFKVFDQSCGGGALMDLNVYNLHLLAGIFGSPLKVHYYPNIEKDVDTSGVIIAEYKDFKATLTAAKDSQGPSRFLIQGTKGYLLVNAPANTLASDLIFYDNTSKLTSVIYRCDLLHRVIPEFKAFSDIIRDKDYDKAESLLSESLAVVELLEKCSLD